VDEESFDAFHCAVPCVGLASRGKPLPLSPILYIQHFEPYRWYRITLIRFQGLPGISWIEVDILPVRIVVRIAFIAVVAGGNVVGIVSPGSVSAVASISSALDTCLGVRHDVILSMGY